MPSFIHPTAQIDSSVRMLDNVTVHAYAVIHGPSLLCEGVTVWDHAVIGRPGQRPGRDPERGFTYIDKDAVIGAGATIYHSVYIGKRVLVGDGARIRESCEIREDCIIGSNCTFQNNVTMLRGARVIDLSHITAGVFIGEDAFVSTGVLTMNDNAFNGNNPQGDPILRAPVIGHRASVGGGAILLPGTNIGNDAVVGAGAVVTKDVPEGKTVVGIPAKIRYPKPVNEGLHDLSYDGTPGTYSDS